MSDAHISDGHHSCAQSQLPQDPCGPVTSGKAGLPRWPERFGLAVLRAETGPRASGCNSRCTVYCVLCMVHVKTDPAAPGHVKTDPVSARPRRARRASPAPQRPAGRYSTCLISTPQLLGFDL
jgi:hypothetical protein